MHFEVMSIDEINFFCYFFFVACLGSAPYGELEISRISTVVGRATGNEDIFLFVKKVDKSKRKNRRF